ncbi:tubulin folding cofactor D C terminal-domain-containing protein [Hypoxylon sp. NC1633]|nr:tubulin folding cofactor D C terminal-domain-containing protein [Hypoxylon sp. NC1633]
MDAPEQDRDVYIQKYSADLLADFDRSLKPFLRKPNGQLRKRVRMRETARLISHVLEPFQELPQLLDPHLPKWLPALAEAYLGCLQEHRKSRSLSMRSQLLLPLSDAICKILYTFCKIRGEKIIVRFLNVETRYLELLLFAIEGSERHNDSAASWTWHERYIVLLWLSQLFLAPFDLSTISSGDADDLDRFVVPGLEWPVQIPGITLRVIPLAIKYLELPGKERDGAKALLVRVAMRKDMQEIGILNALVQWALSTLKPSEDPPAESPYYYIGTLSFLAGILGSAADTSIMDPHLSTIFGVIQAIDIEKHPVFETIKGSALARKMLIKVTRSVATLTLRKPEKTDADVEMVETSISYLLDRLLDNDTPVRLAASKALSIIIFKLEPDMASQVIEAVLEALNRNVLWLKNKSDPTAPPTRDLAAVDPLEWHGLTLTLSHLLYRRSPPAENLSDIMHALLIGLSFEKRSPSGGSIGTNVRDASCFGIWALARRYSTSELLQVQTKSVLIARGHHPEASILQVIATELVVTASLDPAGNIRRGASAALQELIGRHPDTVEKGIAVVQVADYHAVALRSRAIHEVALQATRLSPHYGHALLEATLGWRGIGDMDAGARRVAAISFGVLTAELLNVDSSDPLDRFNSSVELLLSRLRALQVRQVEERHGLLLSLAAVFELLPSLFKDAGQEAIQKIPTGKLCIVLKDILHDSKTTKYRKPEWIAEAAGALVVAAVPALAVGAAEGIPAVSRIPGLHIGDDTSTDVLRPVVDWVDSPQSSRLKEFEDLLVALQGTLNEWLNRNESEVIRTSSMAALVLVVFANYERRMQIIEEWSSKVRRPQTSRNKHGDGFFHALARAHQVQQLKDDQELKDDQRLKGDQQLKDDRPSGVLVSEVLTQRWAQDSSIETRVAIVQSLVGREVLRDRALDFLDIVSEGLDDYTTNARGDIGSHVRLEAIKATKTLWEARRDDEKVISELYPRILRLAAEKLDRVRTEAQAALAMLLDAQHATTFRNLSFSSKEYFTSLFDLCDAKHLHQSVSSACGVLTRDSCTTALLAGLVTSADTGNEELVIASRAALAGVCARDPRVLDGACAALTQNLRRGGSGSDRVVVPTLEVVAYLFHVGLLQRCAAVDLGLLCGLAQRAAFRTGNVRKLEACIRVYGAVAGVRGYGDGVGEGEGGGESEGDGDWDSNLGALSQEMQAKRREGAREARRRLGALLAHPWPRVRCLVVDELWGLMDGDGDGEQQQKQKQGKLLSVDWGGAEKGLVKEVVRELGLE